MRDINCPFVSDQTVIIGIAVILTNWEKQAKKVSELCEWSVYSLCTSALGI